MSAKSRGYWLRVLANFSFLGGLSMVGWFFKYGSDELRWLYLFLGLVFISTGVALMLVHDELLKLRKELEGRNR